jgi:hypothetical protein
MKKRVLRSRPEWVLSTFIIVTRQIDDLSVNSLQGEQRGSIRVDVDPSRKVAPASRELNSAGAITITFFIGLHVPRFELPNMEERQVLFISFTYLTCANR